MERSGIIHGDIKPENILVFDNGSAGHTIRLVDFGHSCFFASKISITGTQGWIAPEWHHRRFTTDVAGAKKMEMYSFGLVCRWLLFDEAQESEKRGIESEDESLLISAFRLTVTEVGSDDKRRHNLLRLFEKTLAEDATARSSEFGEICLLLSPER